MMIAVLVGLYGVTLMTLHVLCLAAKSFQSRTGERYEEIVREDGERAEE